MKSHSRPNRGRILANQRGLGDLSESDVERRAREVAAIAGRTSPTDADRIEALRELRGETLPPTGDVDATRSQGRTRDPSEPGSDDGRETPNQAGADESKVPERLALEGVEEAQHEQMLAARRRRRPR